MTLKQISVRNGQGVTTMIRFNNILIAKDFSECADHALEAGISLASSTGATLHVVYVQVLHDDPFTPELAADHAEKVDAALRRVVDKAAEDVSALDLRQAVLRDVAAAPALARYAADNDIDLVIMGTHGRRGLRHAMLGSVAEEMVRIAPCPVLTIHRDDRINVLVPSPEAEVLLPIDFSSRSASMIPVAREIAASTGASLRVLHVVEETMHPAFYNAGAFSIYDLQPDIEEKALAQLKSLYSKSAGPVVPVRFEVVIGHAASEIVAAAEATPTGMIVMATHGLTGLAHFFLGSVAERVVRLSRCPVLTFRLPEDVHLEPAELSAASHES